MTYNSGNTDNTNNVEGKRKETTDVWLDLDDLDPEKKRHLEELLTRLKARYSTVLMHTLEWQLGCWQMRQTLQTYAGGRGNLLFQRCFDLHFPDVAFKVLLKALGKSSGWFALAMQLSNMHLLAQPADLFHQLLTPMSVEHTATVEQQQQQQQQQHSPTITSFEKLGPMISDVRTVIRARGGESQHEREEPDHEREAAQHLLQELRYCLWNFRAQHMKVKVKERYQLVGPGFSACPSASSSTGDVPTIVADDTHNASSSAMAAEVSVMPQHFWNHSFLPVDEHALSSADGWLTDECINIIGGFFWRQAVRTALLEDRLTERRVLWLSSFFYTKLVQEQQDVVSHDQQMQDFWESSIDEHVRFQRRLEAEMGASPSSAPLQLHLSDFAQVFVPLHVNGAHWLLASYRPQDCTLTFYDSHRKPHAADYLPVAKPLARFFGQQLHLGDVQLILSDQPSPPVSFSSSTISTTVLRLCIDPTFPQQTNGNDCGIYALKAMELSCTRECSTITASDLNERVAQRARSLWTAYLRRPDLHFPGVLQAEWQRMSQVKTPSPLSRTSSAGASSAATADDGTFCCSLSLSSPPSSTSLSFSSSSSSLSSEGPSDGASSATTLLSVSTAAPCVWATSYEMRNLAAAAAGAIASEQNVIPPVHTLIQSMMEEEEVVKMQEDNKELAADEDGMEQDEELEEGQEEEEEEGTEEEQVVKGKHPSRTRGPSTQSNVGRQTPKIKAKKRKRSTSAVTPSSPPSPPPIVCLPHQVDCVPVELVSLGLASWQRKRIAHPARFRQAMDAAVSDLMWKTAEQLEEGTLLRLPEFQQAKHNQSRQASAAYNVVMEGERHARILQSMLKHLELQVTQQQSRNASLQAVTSSIVATGNLSSDNLERVSDEEPCTKRPRRMTRAALNASRSSSSPAAIVSLP